MTVTEGRTETSRLDELSTEEFVAGWRRIVGEPPAALLDDREAMVAMLVESVPHLELTLCEAAWPEAVEAVTLDPGGRPAANATEGPDVVAAPPRPVA